MQQQSQDLFSKEKQNKLEKQNERLQSSSYSSDDEDFYDAVDGSSLNDEINSKNATKNTLLRVNSNKEANSKTPIEDAFNDDSLYENVIDEDDECKFKIKNVNFPMFLVFILI
jgi:hypothetical protein